MCARVSCRQRGAKTGQGKGGGRGRGAVGVPLRLARRPSPTLALPCYTALVPCCTIHAACRQRPTKRHVWPHLVARSSQLGCQAAAHEAGGAWSGGAGVGTTQVGLGRSGIATPHCTFIRMGVLFGAEREDLPTVTPYSQHSADSERAGVHRVSVAR